MDSPHKKAQATREANTAARAVWYEEQTAAKRAARPALQRVTESRTLPLRSCWRRQSSLRS